MVRADCHSIKTNLILLSRLANDHNEDGSGYFDKYGEDLPEIRNWKWGANK
jgi:hypothetical protein